MTTTTTTGTPVPVTISDRLPASALEPRLVAALADLRPGDLLPRDAAMASYAASRRAAAPTLRPYGARRLLTIGEENDKLAKGRGRLVAGLSLAPAMSSGVVNVCAYSTPECRAHCVAGSGNGRAWNVTAARAARTHLLAADPVAFLSLLTGDIVDAARGRRLAVRLNTFSDVRWERVLPAWFWHRFRAVRFYDYTKYPYGSRLTLPANYTLTQSLTGERHNRDNARRIVSGGRNVAAVVDIRGGRDPRTGKLRPIPATLFGLPTIDGDRNDRRWLDAPGRVVVLRRKHTLPAGSRFVFPADA